jgi:hypothetical protein
MGLSAPGMKRARSHSRHSAVTDKGQTEVPMDDLSKIVSVGPGFAEATTLAPERSASPLPSLRSELGSPSLPPPGIVVSDNPMSADTLIPASDTLSTRPTAGGIAYPFSLKVDGPEGKDVNASTLTLASVNITTPPAVDAPHAEKQLGSMMLATEPAPVIISAPAVSESVNEQLLKEERPGVERFETAANGSGAGLFSDGVQGEREKKEMVKTGRPPVERFETAREDLGMLARANETV